MITLEKVTLTFGDFVLREASLHVPTGGYAVLMGRTGSGKTSLLEAIAGLKSLTRGRIFLGDSVEVTRLKPAQRNLGYVPQDGALFTTMSVREQLGFALVIRREPAAQVRARVDALAELLQIQHLLDRGVRGLSGGERQRVALGRALAFRPSTLLLDEPLSALDDETREQMYELLSQIRRQTGVTTLHVTHSREEAERLADLLFRIEAGRIVTTASKSGALPAEPTAG